MTQEQLMNLKLLEAFLQGLKQSRGGVFDSGINIPHEGMKTLREVIAQNDPKNAEESKKVERMG